MSCHACIVRLNICTFSPTYHITDDIAYEYNIDDGLHKPYNWCNQVQIMDFIY